MKNLICLVIAAVIGIVLFGCHSGDEPCCHPEKEVKEFSKKDSAVFVYILEKICGDKLEGYLKKAKLALNDPTTWGHNVIWKWVEKENCYRITDLNFDSNNWDNSYLFNNKEIVRYSTISFPREIWEFDALENVGIRGYAFTGSFPAPPNYSNSNLRSIYIDYSSLSSLPIELFKISKLTGCAFRFNPVLSSLPDELSDIDMGDRSMYINCQNSYLAGEAPVIQKGVLIAMDNNINSINWETWMKQDFKANLDFDDGYLLFGGVRLNNNPIVGQIPPEVLSDTLALLYTYAEITPYTNIISDKWKPGLKGFPSKDELNKMASEYAENHNWPKIKQLIYSRTTSYN